MDLSNAVSGHFLLLTRSCFFAAFMLSTKLGYFLPSVALARDFDLGESFVCRLFFGAGRSHGGDVALRFIKKLRFAYKSRHGEKRGGEEILASLAALRARVMSWMNLEPGVALSESGNPGLISSTPSVSSLWRNAKPFRNACK